VGLTDSEGRYTVVGLTPGAYTVQVTKPAYLSMYYGARRPVIAQGQPVKVEPGQKVTGIDVKLQRGSVVTGVVIGTDGERTDAGSIVSAHDDDGERACRVRRRRAS
jgi:hypothetical protein